MVGQNDCRQIVILRIAANTAMRTSLRFVYVTQELGLILQPITA